MRTLILSAIVFVSAIVAGNVAHAAQPVFNVDGNNVTEITRCGMEWKATGGKSHKDVKWPQYWSACAKTIKADAKAGAMKVGTMKIDLAAIPKPEVINVAK